MKNKTEILSGFLVLALCCTGLDIGAFFSEQTVSRQENRTLQVKPQLSVQSYLSGDYFRQWEEYLSDHVPGRALFLQAAETVEQAIAYSGKAASAQIVETTVDVGVQQGAQAAQDGAKQELLVLEDRLLELYHYDSQACDSYARAVNAYADWLPEQINMYHMLVPMRIAFEEQQYRQLSDNQQQAIGQVYGQLDSRIRTIDVYTRLEQHQAEPVYFRTDHHWTALGAYYGAQAFAEAAGITLPALEQYEVHTMSGYLGQLALNHLTAQLEQHPEDVVYYVRLGHHNRATMYYYEDGQKKSFQAPMLNENFNAGKADYGIFISGDYPYTVVEGDAKNGRVLAVVKDSYGNALVPWLAAGYETIVAIDPRTCQEDLAQLLAQYGVTDFLLLDYVKVTATTAYGAMLEALLVER